jgi:hypothetical protein
MNKPPIKQIMKRAKQYESKGMSKSKALKKAWADAKAVRSK